jgi:hypothetical protein
MDDVQEKPSNERVSSLKKWLFYLETIGLIFQNSCRDNYGSCEERKLLPIKKRRNDHDFCDYGKFITGDLFNRQNEVGYIALNYIHRFSFSRESYINLTPSSNQLISMFKFLVMPNPINFNLEFDLLFLITSVLQPSSTLS